MDFAAADVGAAFSVVSANRLEISDCDVWATSNFAYIYVSSGLCHEPVQFDCQHFPACFSALCCLLGCACRLGATMRLWLTARCGCWLLPQDSRNIVIARNRVRYGGFGLRLGHSVRALVESNDIGGTGWVAGGAIFLSMYEYAGGACQRILIAMRRPLVSAKLSLEPWS